MLQGNQHNRSVMLNSKVVDYINFILRSGEFKNCSPEVVSPARAVHRHAFV